MTMFRWLRGTEGGLSEVEETFVGMLADDRHVFDLAMSARVGGADPATLEDDLLRTEERTDEAERRIRRLVLIHASVHGGSADIAACLMYMSVAKDAERIADLSKNLFGIATAVGAPPPGGLRDDLARLWDEISPMITSAGRIFGDEDKEAAQEFIAAAREVQDYCRRQIDGLLLNLQDHPQPAATVLTYRHLGRICANLLNIVSSVVVPLDQLDYPTP
jgi:phosphate uptake regulator